MQNTEAWSNGPSRISSASLDSSLKKNTAFIKKARLSLTADNLSSLRTDVKSLSLEKYISEVVSAIAEGLTRLKTNADLLAATEIVSLLHQRFTIQFTPNLALHLLRGLAPPSLAHIESLSAEQRDREESVRITKQKSLLKAATDLWLLGVFRSIQDALDVSTTDARRRKLDEALPIFCLRELLLNDLSFINLPLATTFIKGFPDIISPDKSSFQDVINDSEASEIKLILTKYYELLKTHLQKQQRNVVRQSERLEESRNIHGSISQARELEVAELRKAHERQIVAARLLSSVLNLEMPDYTDTDDRYTTTEASMIRGVGSTKILTDSSSFEIWEDEDQRRFYENLINLENIVPSDILNDGKVNIDEALTSNDQKLEDLAYDDSELETELYVEEDVIPAMNTTVGAKVESLLLRLPELNNREMIDKACVEFAFLNSKASRNKLLRTLLNVPNNRTDILPYYARLVATLSQALPVIATTIVQNLHRDCRRFVKGKGLNKDISLRTCNIKYLGELAKFQAVPPYIIFHCFNIMIEGFTKSDIEILSVALENCGRYLLKTQETSVKMQTILDILMNKIKNVSGVERSLIENAFYYVNPPERSSIPQKPVNQVHQYIDKLLFTDLTKKSQDRVLRQLRRLDWKSKQAQSYLLDVFTQVWKIDYSSIGLLAALLSGLAKFHSYFVVHVIDSVFEQIKTGLEENRFRDNQKRIAIIKYLGELHNHKLLEHQHILSILYLIVSFAYSAGRPTPEGSILDPPKDFFRIRLILILLDCVGASFNDGNNRRRLDLFLHFFQYYLKTKGDIPMDTDFAVRKTYLFLRPDFKISESLEEAVTALDETVKKSISHNDEQAEIEEDASSSVSSLKNSSVEDNDSSDDSISDEDHVLSPVDNDEEQHYVLLEKKRAQDDLDREAEEQLEREFSRMMTETGETKKQEVRKPLDIVLPRRQVAHAAGPSGQDNTSNWASEVQGSQDSHSAAVPFTFLSKQGKQRMINLPRDSALAKQNAALINAELEEKKTIRDLTLKYEGAQNREELEESAARSGIHVR